MGSQHPEATTDADASLYAELLTDPDRARASCLVYRTFLLEDAPAVLAAAERLSESLRRAAAAGA